MLASSIIKQSCLINLKCSVFVNIAKAYKNIKKVSAKYKNMSFTRITLTKKSSQLPKLGIKTLTCTYLFFVNNLDHIYLDLFSRDYEDETI